MDTQNSNDEYRKQWDSWQQRSRNGRIVGGIILVGIGGLLMARQSGLELPPWLITWPMFLIVSGLFAGARHSFHSKGWLIPVGIGLVFLLDDMYPEIIGPWIWPALVIIIGLFMILTPRRHKNRFRHWERWMERKGNCGRESSTSEDSFESVSIFGGVKKHVITKNFKGGEVTCIMGGAEINMSQADFTGRAVLEVTQILGGTKIIIPPHWEIKTDMTAILGGIEDKRPVYKDAPASESGKVLEIQGTSIFGGIEISSY